MLGFKTVRTLFRLVALFSCILALVSTSLCFFAGIKHTKLDDFDILTVNTSMSQHTLFNKTNPFSSLSESRTGLTQRTQTYSVYSVYVLRYCKSYYISNTTNNSIQVDDVPLNKTCQWYGHLSATNSSIPTALSSISQSIETISSLNQIVLRMIKLVTQLFATFYAFGFFVTALAFVGFLGSPGGRMRTIISVILSWIAVLVYGLACALVTLTTRVSHLMTQEIGHGNEMTTSTGRLFLALSWTAVAAMLIAVFTGTWSAIFTF